MPPFQCRELLAKNEVFKKEPTTRAEEAKNRTYQESDGLYHEVVLSHFACERQRCILLKSQADRILANDRVTEGLGCWVGLWALSTRHPASTIPRKEEQNG